MLRCSDLGNALGKETATALVKNLQLPAFVDKLERAGQGDLRVPDTPRVTKLDKPAKVEAPLPFILGEALPVVPAKLVKHILRGEYIDMTELLKDNIEVERRLVLTEESSGPSRGTLRAIPNLLNWLYCYSLFTAILCSKYPEKSREMYVGLPSHNHWGS